MKDLTTGEITPPLPHDEYQEQFAANVEAERREKAKAAGTRGRTRAGAVETDEDEPEFHGKPLRFYDGKSDEQITSTPGIAEGTLAKIRDAQKKFGRK